ncbi:MAG: 2-phospho-L-lactate transferase [Betaproteobacteria bacterium]|nr:2-phospho-L-lactate transferase [Betaproteobacteria bacterium]
MGKVVALAGQVGGAKLAEGLARLRGQDLTVIVNTGDDYEQLGLAFSPDLDTMLYTLSGNAGPGWEPAGESFTVFEMLKSLGGPDRPRVGDKSLAIPILRSDGLRNERSLSQITLDLCRHLGIRARVLPMSDDPVRTQVVTADGSLPFLDYFMQLGCEPPVHRFEYPGAQDARIPDAVVDALHATDLEAVVICPSNPYHSIRPILEVKGMRELLRKRGAPVIAVTPIIGSRALRGSAAKMMRELGREVSARGVAIEYFHLIDGFVIDREDESLAESIRSVGIEVATARAVMRTQSDRTELAGAVLEFADRLRAAKLRAAEEA